MLTITLLGTAATMPLPDRALSAAFAACGGHGLLWDCGEGTQAAARRAGVNLMRADAICLTHYHGDHIFGLPGLLQTLGAQGRTRPLALLGPEGLPDIWAAVRALTGPLPYPVKPQVLMPGQPLALDALSEGWPAGARLVPFATKHRVKSLGYRLELPRAGKFSPEQAQALGVPVQQWKMLQKGQSVAVEGRTVQPAQVLGAPRKGLSVVFSGDTAPCPYYLQAAHDADLLICDATYALPEQEDQARQWGHSTFGQSATLAAQARAKRLWLTHYSPMITDPEEYAAQAQSIFPAAECGFDGKASPCSTRRHSHDHPDGRGCGRAAVHPAQGGLCSLRGGRLRAGQSAGPYTARLGPVHQCSAAAGDGAVRRAAVHPHRPAARHGNGEAERCPLRDHHLPYRRHLHRWPPPGRGALCAGCAGGSGPAGSYHQRHGLQ